MADPDDRLMVHRPAKWDSVRILPESERTIATGTFGTGSEACTAVQELLMRQTEEIRIHNVMVTLEFDWYSRRPST